MRKTKSRLLSLVSSVFIAGGMLAILFQWLAGDVMPSHAAPAAVTWYVDAATGDDDNGCQTPVSACLTVGAAVSKASDDDTIQVAAGVYTESLNLFKDLTVIGAGTETTFLDGNHTDRVLQTSAQVTLTNITVRHGLPASNGWGGGIFNTGVLALQNARVFSNTSNGIGGGIYNANTLIIDNSEIISNSSAGGGGGIFNNTASVFTATGSLIAGNSANDGGGVYAFFADLSIADVTIRDNDTILSGGGLYVIGGTAVLSRTTIHGNETEGTGGGVVNNQAIFTLTNTTISHNAAVIYGGVRILDAAQTTIVNSTIANNEKTSGGGAGGINNSSTATITMKNSIVAGNDGNECTVSGTWVSEGHNLSSDSSCSFTQSGDVQNTDPLLGALADYGGQTWTHPLLPGSPAIDAGDNTGCPATDQRGISRPVDGDNDSTAVCDIGSYEARNQIAIDDVVVSEGDGGLTNAVFTVTLSPTSTQPITVDYASADGSATLLDNDYNEVSDTITFASGQATQLITVTVNGDTDDETDETFTVNLSNAQGADLIDDQAVGTIVDDDGLPSLTIDDQAVDEGNSGSTDAVFAVTLSPPSAQSVTVAYTTMDGSATAGSDYESENGMLTFTPGQTTQMITVTVNGDVIDEGNSEFFTIDLSSATNANLADDQGNGTILDDDLAQVSMGSGPQVVEGDSGTTTAVFTVTLSTPTSFTVTVDYATDADIIADGYATANSDYTPVSGTLTFAPGETTQLIMVTVFGDELAEPDEIFSITLSNADPISIFVTSAIGRILSDDYEIYLALTIK